ncbi:MAG: hypothetical protein IJS59_07540 [Bacteroidaceae bacterium]|nr:hypothetical protein [Bacteroidaceae bacterium]
MKQRLLSVLSFAALTVTAMAQTWTEPVAPVAPASGEPVEWVADGVTSYYIKNVGCGQYLMGANSWATQISVSSDGAPLMKVVIEDCGDPSYPDAVKIKVNGTFKFYGGNGYENGRDIGNTYLFRDGETNGFIDHNNQACWYWNIIESSNEGNYYIQSAPTMGGYNNTGEEYMVAQAPGQACLMNGTNNDAMSEWQFINSEGVDLNALEQYNADVKIYEARLKLYNLYLDAVKYGANTDAAGAVYNNSAATVEEIEAARAELLKAMPAAVVAYATSHGTAAEPFAMPYVLYNADFSEGNINGWTIAKPEGATGNYQYQGSKYVSQDEATTIHGFIESWVPAPAHLGDVKIYQKIGGLPNGHYILECDAMAVNQTNPDNDPDNAVEKDDYTGVYLYYSDGTITMHGDALASDFKYVENEETGEGSYASFPAHFVYEFDLSTTADTIMIGLMSENTNLNWMGADNFVLKYAGNPQSLPSYTALVTEISTSEAYKATDPEAQTAVKDAFATALAEAQALVAGGSDDSKDAQYQAAYTKLSEARAAVVASAAAYVKLNEFIAKLNEEVDKYSNMSNYDKMVAKIEALLDVMEEAQSNYNLSAAEIEEAINGYDAMISDTVKEIFDDLVAANEPLDEPFEITGLFPHMSYPDTNGSDQESFPNGYPAENPVWMNETATGNFKTNFGTAEVWNANFHIYRDFENLPKGKYTIQTKAFYRVAENAVNYPSYMDGTYEGTNYAYIYAGSDRGNILNVAEIASHDTNTTGGATLELDEGTVYIPNSQQGASEIFTAEQWAAEAEACTVEASGLITSETGTLRVGVKGENLSGNSWVIWYSWRLFYNGEDPSAYDEVIEGLIAQAQELTPVLADAPAKLEAAIQAGQSAMDNDDKDAKVAAITALNEAIKYANDGDALFQKMKNDYNAREERIMALEEKGFTYTNTSYIELLAEVYNLDPDFGGQAPQSLEQIQTYIDRMANEWDAFVWSKAGLDDATVEDPVSMGEIIVNGDFKDASKDAWTIVNPDDPTKAPEYGGTWADEVAEFWNSAAFDISQEVVLLKDGYWRLSADALFRTTGDGGGEATMVKDGTPIEDNEMYLYVRYPGFYKETKIVQWSDFERGAVIDNEENTDLISMVTGVNYTLSGSEEEGDLVQFVAPNTRGNFITFYEAGRYKNSVDFGYPTAGVAIKIGIVLKSADKNNWCPFDNFDLLYLGQTAPDAVEGIAASGAAATEQVFGIDGRIKSGLTRGINIVRTSDGVVRKVLVK